jgi:hypothetical protein
MVSKLKPAKAKSTPRRQMRRMRRLSRSVIEEMLTDLCHRLEKQVWTADAIARAVAPSGDTCVCGYPKLRVIELAAATHLADLQQAAKFAELINSKVTP